MISLSIIWFSILKLNARAWQAPAGHCSYSDQALYRFHNYRIYAFKSGFKNKKADGLFMFFWGDPMDYVIIMFLNIVSVQVLLNIT